MARNVEVGVIVGRSVILQRAELVHSSRIVLSEVRVDATRAKGRVRFVPEGRGSCLSQVPEEGEVVRTLLGLNRCKHHLRVDALECQVLSFVRSMHVTSSNMLNESGTATTANRTARNWANKVGAFGEPEVSTSFIAKAPEGLSIHLHDDAAQVAGRDAESSANAQEVEAEGQDVDVLTDDVARSLTGRHELMPAIAVKVDQYCDEDPEVVWVKDCSPEGIDLGHVYELQDLYLLFRLPLGQILTCCQRRFVYRVEYCLFCSTAAVRKAKKLNTVMSFVGKNIVLGDERIESLLDEVVRVANSARSRLELRHEVHASRHVVVVRSTGGNYIDTKKVRNRNRYLPYVFANSPPTFVAITLSGFRRIVRHVYFLACKMEC